METEPQTANSEDVFQDAERLDLPSASQMHIVVECPGQPNLKAAIPTKDLVQLDRDEATSQKGDHIHDAFQTGNTLLLTEEETGLYNKGLAYLEKIKAKWIEDKVLHPVNITEGERELRVFLQKPWDFPNPMGSAQTDRHFIYDDGERRLLLVLDLKTGWNPDLPPSAKSWQLKYELISLAQEYGNIDEGRVAYVKAADKHEYGDFTDYNEIDLKYSWDSIVFHSWMSTQEDASRHAGAHCRWCPCKAHCPEAFAFALLPSAFAILKGRKVELKDEIAPNDLYRLWEAGSAIRSILDAIVARLKAMPDDQLAAMGIMRSNPVAVMDWTDIKGAFEFLREQKKWNEDDLWKALSFTLGKLELLIQKEMGVGESEANLEVKKLLLGFYAVREGERRLKKLK
jgi:hypothetical protein